MKKPKKNDYIHDQKVLQKWFDLLNTEYFEGKLEDVILTIQSFGRKKDTLGWFTVGKVWENGNLSKHEINISAEYMNRAFYKIITTLLHEMVHLYCSLNEIKDVSRGGSYHNKAFKAECEKRALEVEFGSKSGWSQTIATPQLRKFIDSNFVEVDEFKCFRKDYQTNSDSASKSSYWSYQCVVCESKARSSKELNLQCCDEYMDKEER